MTEQQDKDKNQKIQPASGIKRKRNIRIFISSTFQDMQEERDVLVKKFFPQLRKICMERGVGFTEVDLRWGVTQEQVDRSEVLPLCLAEIENCRPYFIGLLGERYGWVPDFIPDELIADRPWIAEHRQRSITELEVIHGVLNNPSMADHAFFYFRDPMALDPVKQDIDSIDKQTALKDRIRQSGLPLRENYLDAETVGQLLLKDLKEAIDTEFPEQQLTPHERDYLDHEVFAESRAKVYICRQEYFDRLDAHATGNADSLTVLGESGSGKSALLANWIFRFQEKHPNTFLLFHFIGSSINSTDYVAMLRRIMKEIKERYDLPNDIPDKPDLIRYEFPNWLSMAAARGRFVLVLDALDQLEDKDNAPDLAWLPEFIPTEVRLIVSTLPGRSLNELKKRQWSNMKVQPLETEERKQLIKEYLFKLYSKKLPQNLVERIASQQQCANPLFLHALLEELRIFGKHEEITSRIDHYLRANNLEKLYEMILTRLEEDYEQYHPGLVGEAMSLLWAARRGLSERELLDIMEIAPITWSPFYLALEESLVIRSGLVGFFHDFLGQAVKKKYLNTPEKERHAHIRIADYFETCEINQRKIEELPWQLMKAEDWERLKNTIADMDIFLMMMKQERQYELTAYWQGLGSMFDLAEVYSDAVNRLEHTVLGSQKMAECFENSAHFLQLNTRYESAAMLFEKALEERKKLLGPTHPDVATDLRNLAGLMQETNDYSKAEELLGKALGIHETHLGLDHPEVATDLNNMALLFHNTHQFNKAEPMFRRALDIYARCYGSNHPYIATALGNLAELLMNTHRLKEAESLLERALEISQNSLGKGHPETATILNRLGLLLFNTRRPVEAEPLIKKALEICKASLGNYHPKVGFASLNLAELLMAEKRFGEAESLYRDSLKIKTYNFGPDHTDVAMAKVSLASVLLATGRNSDAEPLLIEAIGVFMVTCGPFHQFTLSAQAHLEHCKLHRSANPKQPFTPIEQDKKQKKEKPEALPSNTLCPRCGGNGLTGLGAFGGFLFFLILLLSSIGLTSKNLWWLVISIPVGGFSLIALIALITVLFKGRKQCTECGTNLYTLKTK